MERGNCQFRKEIIIGKPSDEEVLKFRDIAWKYFGIDDVIKKLGKPKIDLPLVIHDA